MKKIIITVLLASSAAFAGQPSCNLLYMKNHQDIKLKVSNGDIYSGELKTDKAEAFVRYTEDTQKLVLVLESGGKSVAMMSSKIGQGEEVILVGSVDGALDLRLTCQN